MLVKTSELSGAQLDYAVAKCEGMTDYEFPLVWLYYKDSEGDGDNQWHYSSNWSHGGPLIEQEQIRWNIHEKIGMYAWISDLFHDPMSSNICDVHGQFYPLPKGFATGPTPLIAAMRCLVIGKMGDTIEIPDELLK